MSAKPLNRLTDHPRVSGEHRTEGAMAAVDFGSSPRERGAHKLERSWRATHRIIPA